MRALAGKPEYVKRAVRTERKSKKTARRPSLPRETGFYRAKQDFSDCGVDSKDASLRSMPRMLRLQGCQQPHQPISLLHPEREHRDLE
jgi:hypothetical protein